VTKAKGSLPNFGGAHAGLGVSTYPFLEGYSDNVIAELPGSVDPSKIVILSAHYDSRSTDLKVNMAHHI